MANERFHVAFSPKIRAGTGACPYKDGYDPPSECIGELTPQDMSSDKASCKTIGFPISGNWGFLMSSSACSFICG